MEHSNATRSSIDESRRSVQGSDQSLTIGLFLKIFFVGFVTFMISTCIWVYMIVPCLPRKIRIFIQNVFKFSQQIRRKINPREEEVVQLLKKARYRCLRQIATLKRSTQNFNRPVSTETAARNAINDLQLHRLYIKQLMEEFEEIGMMSRDTDTDTESGKKRHKTYSKAEKTAQDASDTIVKISIHFPDIRYRNYL